MEWPTCRNGKWTCETVPCQGLSEQGRTPKFLAEEAYKEYAAEFGDRQTLGRLIERGGFGADEIALLLFFRIQRLRAKYEPQPGLCEHGVQDGEWCEECNKAYKEARRENEAE
jgi:hypothetical protein